MSSSPSSPAVATTTDPLMNNPLINTITGYIVYLQQQGMFSKERVQSIRHGFLISVGFLVLLYCLIRIQILFFWLLRLLFRFIFKLISIVFWLPLKTARFFIPKTIDYDILFPLFWLCSISSFYMSKYSHENICQFYDHYIVRRYKFFTYDQTKREEIKKYLFIVTFIVLLLLQSFFILIPIALSIRHQHENIKVPSTPVIATKTSSVRMATSKSPVKEVVETMSDNLYQRFINAFKDENETDRHGKRPPLVSDEKLEDTFKSIQKTIKSGMTNLKSTTKNDQNEINEGKKSSRFQRWIVYYLKAPFQKWEGIKTEVVQSKNEPNRAQDENEEDEEEEDNVQLNSSSSLSDTDESDDEDDDDDDDDDDDEQEDHTTITEKIKQRLETVQNLGDKLKENVKNKLSSSTASDDEESDDESDEDDDDDESSRTITDKIKEQLSKPIIKVKGMVETAADQLQNKLRSTIEEYEEDSGYESDDEEDEEEQSSTLINKIKESLAKPIQTVEDLGEKVIANVQNKLSSSASSDEEDIEIESDEEENPSLLERVQENIIKPIETTATNLRDKLPSLNKEDDDDDDDDSSIIDRTKQAAEKLITPIADKIASNADELKHRASNFVDSAEDMTSNVIEKSSEFLKEKAEQVKDALPKPDEVISQIKHQVVEPLEAKASKIKKDLKSKSEHLKTTVVNKIKSLKKEKKPKTLTEKVKDKFKSLTETIEEKLPGHKKSKKSMRKNVNQMKSKLKTKSKLNGWIDEAWNIWHQAKRNLAHIFLSSTKHARHLPRYNTTSLYTAYTDLKCNDYTKQSNRYRSSKRNYLDFLDTYRHHSPFPVYLSILKSNGPKCYRQYPNSSCALTFKTSNRNFKIQLYRFVRFWAMVGLIIIVLGVIYKYLTSRKKTNLSSAHPYYDDSDRSSNKQQQQQHTIGATKADLSGSSVITQKASSDNENVTSTKSDSHQLNEQIEQQLRLWLQHEQNDGFRNLSETCRLAINDTFFKQLERLSVETLQFANAKIRNVSQNNNNNRSGETTAEKIVINAILDIDHLILNIVNTFKEQHFSFESPKVSGQLYILLVINPNQYSIEANLQQLQIQPVNIIDPNHILSADEKQTITKSITETINRTVVRCSFRLSDNQENTNTNILHNSSLTSYPAPTKSSVSPTQLSTSSIQTSASRSHQSSPSRYHTSDSIPTVLINDTNQHLYSNNLSIDKEPKRLLVRIVKAVKLHDVEQPYCILELNHPKQIHQTSIAKNGLNPFWDERFLFECDDKSNQIHLQIIDRKTTIKRTGNTYVDSVYADVLIPFSYVTSTVYKQDVQISPQYPESIVRIEFSTLSEEEALVANNGYDVESLTDSQTWTFNDRETHKIEHDYPQRYQQSPSNDFSPSSYDAGSLPKHYGLSSSVYDDERDYASTLPRPTGHHSAITPFSLSTPLTPRDGSGLTSDKPQKSKSFMSSLKHLTLPRRKQQNKTKYETNMGSQASSVTQLNTSLQSPPTNLTSHSLSSALPGPHPEYFLSSTMDQPPIRRSRSISQSFKNLFRSSSKKKAMAAKADALGEFENGSHNYIGDNRNYLSTSVPTSKKLSFLQRRKSKQKAKQQSVNSLSSYDCSRMESMRDTPVRANVGHPVTMTKSLVR